MGGKGWDALKYDETTEQELRQAILNHPRSARAHLNLGSFSSMLSIDLERINEGLLECHEAVRLKPRWDVPRIAIANVLIRIGRHNDALRELEEASRIIPKMTPYLAYSQGFARMICKDLIGAITMFEKAIEERPEYALAYDNAAHCCFQLQDKIKGKRYAKQAHHFGISTTYNAWQNHAYDKDRLTASDNHSSYIYPIVPNF